MDFEVIFEKDGKFILASVVPLPVRCQIVFPLGQIIWVLQEINLLRIVDRAGKEIEKLVRYSLIVGDQAWEIRGVLKCLIRVQTRAAGGFRNRGGRRCIA